MTTRCPVAVDGRTENGCRLVRGVRIERILEFFCGRTARVGNADEISRTDCRLADAPPVTVVSRPVVGSGRLYVFFGWVSAQPIIIVRQSVWDMTFSYSPPPRLLGNFPFPDDLDKDIFVDETVQVRVATRLESCSARVMLNNLPRHRERQTKNIVEYYLLIFLSVALPAFFSRSFKLGILVSTKLVRGMIINQRRTWEFRVRYK